MTRPRVAGVMVARNEWPLLAASATHLLMHHVDRLWILDHASTDETPAGLSRLQSFWGDRLVVYRLDDVPYLQEALLTTALVFLRGEPFDWVYVADADEFAITPERPLADLLSEVPDDVDVVRYELDNWIAPRSFQHVVVDDLILVQRRAVPSSFLALPSELISEQIEAGDISYFDIPFESKIIVRLGALLWMTAGAHSVGSLDDGRELTVDPRQFKVAHLPLLSRDRLELRVDHARHLSVAGLPYSHGWQSHLIRRLVENGGVEDFWRRHTYCDSDVPVFESVHDDAFARAIEPVLKQLAEHPDIVEGGSSVQRREPRRVSLAESLEALHFVQRVVATERVVLRDERIGALKRLEERDARIAELEQQIRTIETYAAHVRAAHDRLLASRTWRWGQRLRHWGARPH